MQIVTYTINVPGGSNQTPRVGAILPGDHILDFALATEPAVSGISQLSWLDMDGVPFQRALAAYKKVRSSERDLDIAIRDGLTVKRSDVILVAPVPRPGKLICIGLNYRDHAEESNMPIPERPVVFSKFTTSVIGPGQAVVLPPTSEKVDYEAELAVVIGRYAKNVSLERALDYVLGYTIVNDVSARDFQFADGQWQRGKSCDTFAPMGETITTADEIPDPQNLSIKLRLNGNTMQDSNTDQLIFGIRELIAFLSETITLEPGDVIATGTPPGVGFARKPPVFLKDGDVMEVEIEGLGILTNPVTAAAS
jgi:2-keto-4-pentenoate hydratase/2-oxohepta-3-ene-1,7-dioic acid hydratase in catechol pathway